MRRTAVLDDLVIACLVVAVQHVAAGAGIGVAEADHEPASLVHVVEHDAGRRMLVGERTRTGVRVGDAGDSSQRGSQAEC